MERLIITRGHGFEMGTPGRLRIPGGFNCYTMERPWMGNKVSESCIPPGVYPMRLRNSEVVRRATGGHYSQGWEVTDVPGRTFIMFHPGNTIDDTEGCILPGYELGGWQVGGKLRWAVTSSRDTFDHVMRVLGGRDEWEIEIRYFHP